MYSFPDLEPVCCPCPILTVLIDLNADFSEGKSGDLVFPFFKNFPRFIVIHTSKHRVTIVCSGVLRNTEKGKLTQEKEVEDVRVEVANTEIVYVQIDYYHNFFRA